MEILALGLFLATAGSGLFWLARAQRRGRLQGWHELAAACQLSEPVETGSWFDPGLAARSGDFWVRLEWYSYSRGNWSRSEEAGHRIVLRHAVGDLGGLTLAPETLETAMAKALPLGLGGAREVELGDRLFDGAFYVGGAPARVFAALDAATRARLLRLGGLGRVALSRGELSLEVAQDDSLASFARVHAGLELALDVAARLARAADPTARLAENARADPIPLVRLRCLQVLMREFGEDPATHAVALAACSDPDPEVRLRAASACGAAGGPALLALAEDPSVGDAYAAAAVAALGRQLSLERASSLLERALRERRHETARSCVASLGAHGEPAVAPLARVLALRLDHVADAAARALGATGAASAESALLLALADPRGTGRLAAAEALAHVGSAAAVLPLKEVVARAGRGELARTARQSIAAIQSRLPGASPGQLSLAEGGSGQLSLAEEGGRLSLPEGEPGALSPPDTPEPGA